MICIGVLLASGNIHTIEGGSQNLIVPRDPFYGQGEYCNLLPTITHPVNGATYYKNNLDLNYTYAGATTCRYRIVGYLWNTIPCNGSILRTFGEGENVLELEVSNGLCSRSAFTSFEIISRSDYWGYIDYWFMTWILIMGITIIYYTLYGKRKTLNG